ncbi:outer-membrane lipoprotein (plasmid) [Ralstonia solanacearum Po82]|uniref:Outer-membrane lipoprotein n=1 Tax=Ralstonia solanacearum (strain Po82) TaxID=1031711 RepID=F6G8F2_RALS8|nr:outer-membrane lipoprotein [Ralstonia solanacearum Po82]
MAGQAYRVVLRLNDNSVTTLTQNNPNGLRVGDRARIENGMAVPY